MKKLLLFPVLATMFGGKLGKLALKRYCLLLAVLAFSITNRAELYIVGSATCVGWAEDHDNRSPVAMVQTDVNTFIWVGYLTTADNHDGSFKFPGNDKWGGGYYATSDNYELESGVKASLSTESDGDKQFHVSEEGMWKIVINTNTNEITATKLNTPTLSDGYYQISDLNDYYWYAGMVTSNKDDNNNDGLTSKKARLTTDLTFSSANPFFPIGCYTNKYDGEFDGGSHTIDGIQVSENVNIEIYALGFIRFATAGANIHDLCIGPNSSFSGWRKVGGIIGRIRDIGGEIRLTNVVNAAVITATDTQGGDEWIGNAGGLFACATDVYVTVTNCANLGNVSGQDGQCAAFAGWTSSYNSNKTTFTNCWNSGTISNMQSNINLYRSNSGDAEDSNCYDVTGVATHTQGIKLGTDTKGSGELCYKLNGSSNGGTNWYQNLSGSTSVDACPVPFSTNHDKVYSYGSSYVSEKGLAEIGDATDMNNFATLVNTSGLTSLNAKLTENIDMSEKNSHTPIGTISHPYVGTFDGDFHTVDLNIDRSSENYQGLFGVVTDGVKIEKVIVKGSVIGNEYVGGIVGGTYGDDGDNAHKTDIRYCGNEADITGTTVGGIIGDNGGTEADIILLNCYNTGAITGTNSNTAALCGSIGGSNSSVRNCYNIGTVKIGDVISDKFCINDNAYFINCYCRTTNKTDIVNSEHGTIAIVSDEAVVSGELCWKFYGEGFTQDLSQAGHPTFGSKEVHAGKWFNDDDWDTFYNEDASNNITVYQLNTSDTQTEYNVPDDGTVTAKNVSISRTIPANQWIGLCLPFSYDIPSGWEVRELDHVNGTGDEACMVFTAASSIEAGKPYIVKPTDEVTSITATNKSIATAASTVEKGDVNMIGNFAQTSIPVGSFYINTSSELKELTGSSVNMKGFRAYFTVDGSSTVKALNFAFDDDATAIEMVNGQPSMVNGQPIYNLAGQRIQKMQRGVNIINGKKILK